MLHPPPPPNVDSVVSWTVLWYLVAFQVPSQLLASSQQAAAAAEIQYLQPSLQSYVQYQPTAAAAAAAAAASRLTQTLQPPRTAAQFGGGRPSASDPFQQPLCMSSVILSPSSLTGKMTGRAGGGAGWGVA